MRGDEEVATVLANQGDADEAEVPEQDQHDEEVAVQQRLPMGPDGRVREARDHPQTGAALHLAVPVGR